MRLLVSGCTAATKRLIAERPDRVGVLVTPSNGSREWWGGGVAVGCDNDCFGGLDAAAYLRMLARLVGFRSRPLWVACPDVVADMGKTWASFFRWQPVLAEVGLPAALVLQDGLERLKWSAPLPDSWDRIAAVFVGGSTEWKLSDHAARLTLEAHERGRLVHFGRVSTLKRIRLLVQRRRAGELWVDSIDSSAVARQQAKWVPKLVRWIDGVQREPFLFDRSLTCGG